MVVVLMGFGVFKVHLFLMDAICLSSRRCLFEDGEGLHTGFVLQELLFEDKFSPNAVSSFQKPVFEDGRFSFRGFSSMRCPFEDGKGFMPGLSSGMPCFEDKYSLTAVLSSQMAFFEDKFSSNAVPFSQKPVLRTGQLSSWGLSSGRPLFEENSRKFLSLPSEHNIVFDENQFRYAVLCSCDGNDTVLRGSEPGQGQRRESFTGQLRESFTGHGRRQRR